MNGPVRTDGRDRGRRLARAFIDQVRCSGPRRTGSLMMVAMLAVTVIAGGAVGFGILTRPKKHDAHQAPAMALAGAGRGVTTAGPSPTATTQATPTYPALPSSTPGYSGYPAPVSYGISAGTHTQASRGSRPRAGSPDYQPARPGFSALTGPGCPQQQSASFHIYGWFNDGLSGFNNVSAGGWTQQGCKGGYIAMPMSGSSTTDDPENFAHWTFYPVKSRSCQVSVFVPKANSVEQVGGNPAHYQVFDASGAIGPEVGSFNIDQVANRGRWVSGGSFPVPTGVVTIKAVSRGQDWIGDTKTYAHIAIDAVRVSCSG